MIALFLFLRVALLFVACFFLWNILERRIERNSKLYYYYHRFCKSNSRRLYIWWVKMNKDDNFRYLKGADRIEMSDYHLRDFSSRTPDSYYPLRDFTPEVKIKFCKNEIRKLKEEIVQYLNYTDCRIKPKDVYRLEMLKKEIRELQQLINGNKEILA